MSKRLGVRGDKILGKLLVYKALLAGMKTNAETETVY